MSALRTISSVSATAGTPTPVYSGSVVSAISFSITNNIASIVLGAGNLPTNGYNGPNGFPIVNAEGAKQDIYGGIAGKGSQPGYGQQVTLWGFTTATYFNGKTVTVLDNDPSTGTFRFAFTHMNVASTADAGKTAPQPTEKYRAVRVEIDQSAGTAVLFVGDLNVSSSRYNAALTLAGQIAVELSGDNIDASRMFLDTSVTGTLGHVTLVY
ncbi:MAG TPA: hypothetical protein VGT24_13205 [Candidatus Acidoferrales bacterium]|nr:hypothetical protein [Candidatus Acidoferrales bacterium]